MRSAAAVAMLAFAPILAGACLPSSMDVSLAIRWAFGGMAMMLAVLVLHAVGAPASVAIGAATVVAAAGVVRVRSIVELWRRSTSSDRVVATLVFVPVLAAAIFTLSTPIDAGDAVMAWYAKARAFLGWQPLARLPYAEYPNLMTMAWSLLLRLTGWANEPTARLVFVAVYAAFALALRDIVVTPSRHTMWVVPLAVLATFDLRLITNGYQDAAVGALGGLAVVLFAGHLQSGDRSRALLGLFFAAAIGLVKLEGAVLGAVLVFAWLAAQRFAPLRTAWWLRGWIMYAAVALIWPVMVRVYGLQLDQGQYNAFEGASLLDIPARLGRLPAIGGALIATGPRFLVPLAATTVLAAGAWWFVKSARPVLTFLMVAAVLHAASIAGVFLLTNLELWWHLATAFDRLVLQQAIALWTPAMVVTAVSLAEAR